MRMAKYSIKVANDMMVIVIDDDEEGCPSLTNSADAVIQDLNSKVGGLGSRRVYYRDSVGRFDELCHSSGVFTGFAACKPSQQEAFRNMTQGPQADHRAVGLLNSNFAATQRSGDAAGERRLYAVEPLDGN